MKVINYGRKMTSNPAAGQSRLLPEISTGPKPLWATGTNDLGSFRFFESGNLPVKSCKSFPLISGIEKKFHSLINRRWNAKTPV